MAHSHTSAVQQLADSIKTYSDIVAMNTKSLERLNETYDMINAHLLKQVRAKYAGEIAAQVGPLRAWWWRRTGKLDNMVTLLLRFEGIIK